VRKSGKFPRINLIPREKQQSLFAVPSYALPAFISLFIAVIGITGYRQHLALKKLQQERAAIAQKQQAATAQITALNQQRLQLERKRKQATVIQQILAKKISWSDFFKEMSMMIPKNIWLGSMKAGISKEGRREMIIEGSGDSPQAVSYFFQGLEQSYFFQKVMIVSSKLDPKVTPPLYRFKFKCPMDDFRDTALAGAASDTKPDSATPNEPEADPKAKKKGSPRRAGKTAGAEGGSNG
jgi:Tfp pilus assembly protein PilN